MSCNTEAPAHQAFCGCAVCSIAVFVGDVCPSRASHGHQQLAPMLKMPSQGGLGLCSQATYRCCYHLLGCLPQIHDTLGMIANAHSALADQHPMRAKSEECIALAMKHAEAVDYAKVAEHLCTHRVCRGYRLTRGLTEAQ
jgi:hypothetical protein